MEAGIHEGEFRAGTVAAAMSDYERACHYSYSAPRAERTCEKPKLKHT